MKRITKILVVSLVIMLFSGQAAYAEWKDAFKSKTWWVDKGKGAGRGIKNFAVKSVVHDTFRKKLGSASWWTSSAWSKKVQRTVQNKGGAVTGLGIEHARAAGESSHGTDIEAGGKGNANLNLTEGLVTKGAGAGMRFRETLRQTGNRIMKLIDSANGYENDTPAAAPVVRG